MKSEKGVKLEGFKRQLSANGFKKGQEWNGAQVYIPIYNREFVGGFPKIVIVKDNVARISSSEECFEYIKEIKNK